RVGAGHDHYNRPGGQVSDIQSLGESSHPPILPQKFSSPAESGIPLIRFLLLLGALVVSTALVVAHGLRGVAALVVLLLLVSAPRTRAWSVSERALVRLTGSRKRAAILVMSVVIVVVLRS